MIAIRSRFVPDKIEVRAGDEVTIHVTNVEQTTDMIHGLGIIEHDMNVVVDPGETKTVKFMAGKAGRLSVLLHELLLGAAPGDAGLSRGEAVAHRRESVPAPDLRRPAGPRRSAVNRIAAALRPCTASSTAR